MLLTGGLDGSVCLWDVKRGRKIFHYETQYDIKSVTFSHDGTKFAVSNNRGFVNLFGIGYDLGMYLQTPTEQFFAADWLHVKEDQQGSLVEVESGTQIHVAENGPLMSQYREVYVNLKTSNRPGRFDYTYDESIVLEDKNCRKQRLADELRWSKNDKKER
jgi:WD40 repeat protein